MSRPTTILIVEDQETTRRVIRRLLEDGGYRVIEASDAASALYLIHQHQPDLTLLDIHLPDMSGLEVAALIKGSPFAILTGDSDEVLFEQARKLGAITYFVKPLQQEALFLRQIHLATLQGTRNHNMQRALQGTRDISAALGLLMGSLRVSEEAAFKLLTGNASRRRMPSGAVAKELLQLATDPGLGHPALVGILVDYLSDREGAVPSDVVRLKKSGRHRADRIER